MHYRPCKYLVFLSKWGNIFIHMIHEMVKMLPVLLNLTILSLNKSLTSQNQRQQVGQSAPLNWLPPKQAQISPKCPIRFQNAQCNLFLSIFAANWQVFMCRGHHFTAREHDKVGYMRQDYPKNWFVRGISRQISILGKFYLYHNEAGIPFHVLGESLA